MNHWVIIHLYLCQWCQMSLPDSHCETVNLTTGQPTIFTVTLTYRIELLKGYLLAIDALAAQDCG